MTSLKLYKSGKIGKTMKGTLPFDSKKQTLVFSRKPQKEEPPKRIYYKIPYAKSNALPIKKLA